MVWLIQTGRQHQGAKSSQTGYGGGPHPYRSSGKIAPTTSPPDRQVATETGEPAGSATASEATHSRERSEETHEIRL